MYDVTDDWRTFPQPAHVTTRIIRAEDVLAQRARTIVCSSTLEQRWANRYDAGRPS